MYAYNPDRRGLSEVKLLDLEPWRLYPKNKSLNIDFLKLQPPATLRITRETPIASIGSCFAREIKDWLTHHGYNFIQTADGPCTQAGSARYDRVYNTFTLRQEFERAFGRFEPKEQFWDFVSDERRRLLDPYRKGVAWDNKDEMYQELAEHRKNVQRAFSEAEILIITVGQAEVWYNKLDGYVYPLVPPVQIFDPDKHAFRLTSYEENLENLERVFDLFCANNNIGQIVITVSPIPLRATFRKINSLVANMAGKSILRAAVDAFVSQHSDRVTYFPAYEIVLVTEDDPFKADNRHVRPEVVDRIMEVFESWFL